MNPELQKKLADAVRNFGLPRYRDLPNVGLYLEQTAKYINIYLTSIGCGELTTSMISNYVKKGIIASPVKKQYYAEHIARLMVIAIAKNVVSMDNITRLFRLQERMYPVAVAYDYFCEELESMLCYIFGVSSDMEMVNSNHTSEKLLLRGIVTSVCYRLYLNVLLEAMDDETDID